ncbi:MAG: 4Fe-4S dicluster domain-containing protein [Dehalococcoidia bacterium]|nr:4Fe-4S dicluster domain-containing protein [Dehalococcoidia bacterium]
MTSFITKTSLKTWLGTLLKDNTLVAPAAAAGLTFFRPVEKIEDIAFDFTNTALSPKSWFFPQTETLSGEIAGNGHKTLNPEALEKNAVLFGIRPCDARGLAVTDKVFLITPGDTSYIERRQRTTLVGVACLEERAECFCTRMGSSPNSPADVDILLTEDGDGYLVQVMTKKGQTLSAGAGQQQSDKAVPPIVPTKPPARLPLKSAGPSPDMDYWDQSIADRCIHCNICAFVCPTCYCFDTFDIEKEGKVERLRSWYTCQSPNFERIEGYMADAPKGVRMRHRFYHKLPLFPEQLGSGYAACTGCGRCVVSCPVNIDIREIMDDVEKFRASVGEEKAPQA